jgi:ATP/maltotriose-dependent transcriptional regulator MalT
MSDGTDPFWCYENREEAAALIDRLRAELAAEKEYHRQETEAMQSSFNFLHAEYTKLREALEPFAKEAGEWAVEIPDDERPMIEGQADDEPAFAEFTVGDLRRARAVLKEGGGDE